MAIGINWGTANTGSIYLSNNHLNSSQPGIMLATVYTVWGIVQTIAITFSNALFNYYQWANFNSDMLNNKNTLTLYSLKNLQHAILDPGHADTILQPTSIVNIHLYQLFCTGFLSAFNNTAALTTGFLLLILACALLCFFKAERQTHRSITLSFCW